MPFEAQSTDQAVLAELGRRLARHRLARNWTQADLATRAGLGKATVQRVERGESVQVSSALKLLRALELMDGLDIAVPPSIDLPIAQLEREQRRTARTRRRARPRRSPAEEVDEQPWRWGEEPDRNDVRQPGRPHGRSGAEPRRGA